MKKCIVFFVLLTFNLFAQRVSQVKIGDRIINDDQMLKVLVGSAGDGGFKFIRASTRSLLTNVYSELGSTREEQKDFAKFPINQQGLKFQLRKLRSFGNKKSGFITYGYFNVGIQGFEVDLENAINAKEIEIIYNYEIIDVPKATAQSLVKDSTKTVLEVKKESKPANNELPVNSELITKQTVNQTEPQVSLQPIALNNSNYTQSEEIKKLINQLVEQLTKELTVKITKEVTEKLIKQLKQE